MGGKGAAGPPSRPTTTKQPMIASLQRQSASVRSVINTLRHDEQAAAYPPDLEFAPPKLLPFTARIVCVLDLAVPADANLRPLHVASFAKDHTAARQAANGGSLAAPPTPAGGGSTVEGQGGCGPSDRGRTAGSACRRQSAGYALPAVDCHWLCLQAPRARAGYKQPPERRGTSPEVEKTLAKDR